MKKGSKKSIVWMLVVSMMIIAMHVLPVKAYTPEQKISVKDYVQYGTYENEPILWYVLDESEKGLLLCQEELLKHRKGEKAWLDVEDLLGQEDLYMGMVAAFYLDPDSIIFQTGEGTKKNPYILYEEWKDPYIFVNGTQVTLPDIERVGDKNIEENRPSIEVNGVLQEIHTMTYDETGNKLTYDLKQPVKQNDTVTFSYNLGEDATSAIAKKGTNLILTNLYRIAVQNTTIDQGFDPIRIIKPLQDEWVTLGEQKKLTVTAKSAETLHFKWFKEDKVIKEEYQNSVKGEVSSSYTIPSITQQDIGKYSVEVSHASDMKKTECELKMKQQYQVTTATYPYDAGTIRDNSARQDGIYHVNDMATVTATGKGRYDFVNWTESGKEVSRDRAYTFKVTDHRNLVANFRWDEPEYIPQYTIHVKINPSDAGTVRGDYTYNKGEHVTLKARAKEGYVFESWMEDGEVVSRNEEYSFTVKQDRWLKANFEPEEKNFKEEWEGLSSRQQKAIKEQFEEYLPYTTLEEELTLEQLDELTKGYFTRKQLKEVYRDLDLFEDITDIDLDWKVVNLEKVRDVYFTDLPVRHWAYTNIIELAKRGIVTGYPDYTFKPNKALTVADTFTFLDRILLTHNELAIRQPRSTVERWIEDEASWAFEHVASIGSKLSEKTLRTIGSMDDEYVSRELLAQVLYEVTDGQLKKTKPLVAFTDTYYSDYQDGINYCIRTGLLEGTTSYTMEPTKPVTRAEMMTILQRLDKALNK